MKNCRNIITDRRNSGQRRQGVRQRPFRETPGEAGTSSVLRSVSGRDGRSKPFARDLPAVWRWPRDSTGLAVFSPEVS